MSAIAELIAKLEAASEGSRELDKEIDCHMWPERYVPTVDDGTPQPPDDFGRDELSMAMHPAPHYTTSTDAALTLLPEGFGTVSATINERGPSSMRIDHPYVFGNAATPALALCIAGLRARDGEAG